MGCVLSQRHKAAARQQTQCLTSAATPDHEQTNPHVLLAFPQVPALGAEGEVKAALLRRGPAQLQRKGRKTFRKLTLVRAELALHRGSCTACPDPGRWAMASPVPQNSVLSSALQADGRGEAGASCCRVRCTTLPRTSAGISAIQMFAQGCSYL